MPKVIGDLSSINTMSFSDGLETRLTKLDSL